MDSANSGDHKRGGNCQGKRSIPASMQMGVESSSLHVCVSASGAPGLLKSGIGSHASAVQPGRPRGFLLSLPGFRNLEWVTRPREREHALRERRAYMFHLSTPQDESYLSTRQRKSTYLRALRKCNTPLKHAVLDLLRRVPVSHL